MLTTPILFAIFVLILIIRYGRSLLQWVANRRRLTKLVDQLPGPPALPLIGCAYQFKWSSKAFSEQLEEWGRFYLSQRNGLGILRVWLGPIPLVALARAEAIKPLLESNELITKSGPGYEFIKHWLGTGLLISTAGKWHIRRKLLTPAFHFSILKNFTQTFMDEAQVFVKQIENYAISGTSFDIYPYLKRCALDIICETAMGTRIHAQLGSNADYVNSVGKINQLVWLHERLPWMWLKPIWYLSGNGWEFDKLVKKTTDFTRKVIAERQQCVQARSSEFSQKNVPKKLAFLDLLLAMQSDNKLTDEDIREEVDTFMFEGHDTTASSMGFTIWFLGHNQEEQAKVHAELDHIFGSSERAVTGEDLKEMIYLEQCIKEAMRMLPPVPIIGRYLTEDITIKGYTIPKGVTVAISPLAAGYDPEEFEQPDSFYPDHFLPEKCAKRNPFAFIPFSAGPRNCIGQKFALLEEKAVLSTFFRQFRVESMHTMNQNRPLPEIILKPSRGFQVKIYKR